MPGSGGAVRAFHFARAMADYGDLTLVCLGGPSGTDEVNPEIHAKAKRVIEAKQLEPERKARNRSRIKSWLRTARTIAFPWTDDWNDFGEYCLQHCPVQKNASIRKRALGAVLRNEYRLAARLVNLPPVSLQLYRSRWRQLLPTLASLVADEQFDIIFFENSIYHPLVNDLALLSPDSLLVCNAANIEYKLQERMAAHTRGSWNKTWEESQVKFVRSLERNAFRNCDLVFTCSEQDKLLAEELAPNTTHHVVGNGVDLNYFQPRASQSASSKTILFTGSFRYPPNQDGARTFIENVFPLVTKSVPDCRLVLAGFDAGLLANELNTSDPRISFISSPEDIRPCFDDVAVAVVPLRIGGGTRLKILEAMSMRVPIVSTRIGAEGIPATDGKHLLLADSPDEFANAVTKLLDSHSQRESMAYESSQWVAKNFSWKSLCQRAIEQIDHLIASRKNA